MLINYYNSYLKEKVHKKKQNNTVHIKVHLKLFLYFCKDGSLNVSKWSIDSNLHIIKKNISLISNVMTPLIEYNREIGQAWNITSQKSKAKIRRQESIALNHNMKLLRACTLKTIILEYLMNTEKMYTALI